MSKRATVQPAWLDAMLLSWGRVKVKEALGFPTESFMFKERIPSPARSYEPTGYSAIDYKELEAAIERMFKPAADPAVLQDLSDARADLNRLNAELAKRTTPQPTEQKPNPFEEKWLTATKTIQALRERVAELEKSDDLAAKAVSDTAETEALRAKITELSAQIVAAGEERAAAEAATKEAAKHLATISEMDAELEKARLDLGQTAGWYQVALKRISDLEAELGEARAVKPITISTDELVTAIVFGWGAGFDTAAMCRNTGLSEPTVTRILAAWRNEIQERKAA